MTDGPLLTVGEAMSALRISRSKLYELLDLGAIESVHIGTARRIYRDSLLAYVEALRPNRVSASA